VLPSETTAAIGTRPGGTRSFWLAGFYYLIAAMAVTMWLWRDPASRIVAANPTDSDQFAWFFRNAATAVAHLRLPALTTAGMNAPQGINLMWNTPMPLLGVLLAPLTLLAGPQASITATITLGFAGSALALFAVLRRWNAGVLAAAAGGLVYGFSPALIESARGHYDLQFAVLPPLIVDAALRLATGRRGTWRWPARRFETGRWPALRRGSWLGLLIAAQIFISEELLLDAGIAAVIALAVLAVSRPRAALGRVGDVLAGTAAAFVVAVLIAGYALCEQFLGPLRQRGSPFTPDFYKNDLAGFVQPSAAMLAHTRASAEFAAAFQGGSPEYLAYLGWPMLLVLAAVAVLFWRLPTVRVAAVVFVVLAALSLGGTLLAGGHEHAWAKLPWYWLQTAPVAGSVIPDRFSILADGAAAALFAFGLDAARARWADARPSAGQCAMARVPAAGRGIARVAVTRVAVTRVAVTRALIALAALAALAPLVPRPLPAGSGSGVPAGWTAAFAALRLPAGARVLVLPIPVSTFTEPLRWQADTGEPSSLVGGYFMGPDGSGQAETDGSGLPAAGVYLNRLWVRSATDGTAKGGTAAGAPKSVPAVPSGKQVRAEIAVWDPAAVVAVTGRHSALGRYLTGLLGPPAISVGAILGWRLRIARLDRFTYPPSGLREGPRGAARDAKERPHQRFRPDRGLERGPPDFPPEQNQTSRCGLRGCGGRGGGPDLNQIAGSSSVGGIQQRVAESPADPARGRVQDTDDRPGLGADRDDGGERRHGLLGIPRAGIVRAGHLDGHRHAERALVYGPGQIRVSLPPHLGQGGAERGGLGDGGRGVPAEPPGQYPLLQLPAAEREQYQAGGRRVQRQPARDPGVVDHLATRGRPLHEDHLVAVEHAEPHVMAQHRVRVLHERQGGFAQAQHRRHAQRQLPHPDTHPHPPVGIAVQQPVRLKLGDQP
jgi:hypothetical protein